MGIREDMLAEIEAFIIDNGMNATGFSVASMNDRTFVGRLRRGTGLSSLAIDRVRAYLDDAARKKARAAKRSEQRALLKAKAAIEPPKPRRSRGA